MTINFRPISRSDAQKVIATGMKCPFEGEGLRISALSECLRAVTYLCSLESESWVPTSSNRLASMVRSRLTSMWPEYKGRDGELFPGEIGVLDCLNSLGDMVRLKGGKWLIAPPKLILVENGVAVLIGGGPLECLPPALSVSAKVVGKVRVVDPALCGLWGSRWGLEDWLGAPYQGLEEWGRSLLSEALLNLTDAPHLCEGVSIYKPRQWVSVTELSEDTKDLVLGRSLDHKFFSYFLCKLNKGRVSKLRSITSDEARRFQYYLDLISDRSIVVSVKNVNNLVRFKLNRRLPRREAKLLNLGWQEPTTEKVHPGVIQYVYPEELFPLLVNAFSLLGIKVKQIL